MASLDGVLRAGEEVRFEAHARGWAHFMPLVLVPYSSILMLTAFQELQGNLVTWQIGPVTVPIPLQVPALLLILVTELYRTADFRSRVYVVTSERVLRFSGVFRFRERFSRPVSGVTGLQLDAGIPTLLFGEERVTLFGLDSLDLESIAAALKGVPVLEPRAAGFFRRRGKLLALALALSFVALVEVEALLQRRARASFQQQWTKVMSAVAAAEAATKARFQADGLSVQSYGGYHIMSLPFVNVAMKDVKLEANDARFSVLKMIRVEVGSEQSFELIPSAAPVTVESRGGDAAANSVFLAELKKSFEEAGILALWPEPRKP